MNSIAIRKSVFILIITITFLLTSVTLFLTLFYVDPYIHTVLGVPVFIFSFGASLCTFLTLLIYFLKRIYFRGEIYIHHILTSFRQSFLITIFVIGCWFFISLNILNFSTFFLFAVLLFFIELFVKNIYRKY